MKTFKQLLDEVKNSEKYKLQWYPSPSGGGWKNKRVPIDLANLPFKL